MENNTRYSFYSTSPTRQPGSQMDESRPFASQEAAEAHAKGLLELWADAPGIAIYEEGIRDRLTTVYRPEPDAEPEGESKRQYEITEESGASEVIEAESLREALERAKEWASEGDYTERVTVHVSAHELDEDGEYTGESLHGETEAGPLPDEEPEGLGPDSDPDAVAEAISDERETVESAAEKTGWPIIDGCLVPRPETWYADDGNQEMEYEVESGQDAAQEYVDGGDWGDREETSWIHVSVWQRGIDEDGAWQRVNKDKYTITLEPIEPECGHEDGHDWQSPQFLGGLKENPGVWGHGGGIISREVCMRCGCERKTDTWAQDPETGEQGLTQVSYEPGKYADALEGEEEE